MLIPKRKLVVSQNKEVDVATGEVPFPKRMYPLVKVVAPVPPYATGVVELYPKVRVTVPEPVITPLTVMLWLAVKNADPLHATTPPAEVISPLPQVPKAETVRLVVEAIPPGVIWNKVALEDEATNNGALDPAIPLTSKAMLDVVALMPTTVPSFIKEAAPLTADEEVQ